MPDIAVFWTLELCTKYVS